MNTETGRVGSFRGLPEEEIFLWAVEMNGGGGGMTYFKSGGGLQVATVAVGSGKPNSALF